MNPERPAVRRLGGKWRIAPWLISFFPRHTTYCEPFGGGANVLLRKPPSRLEIYNDLDDEIVNFFAVLRRDGERLMRQIELTPFARQELALASEPCDDPMESARRFYVRSWQAFQAASGYDATPTWRFQRSWARGKSTLDEWCTVESLRTVIERLRLVQIECRPALEIIARYDTPSTLFYIDPPYLHETRGMRVQTVYAHEMDEADHVELARVLRDIEGMAIVSGYASDLYNDLYRGWEVRSKTTTTNGNSTSIEYAWLSPAVSSRGQLALFTEV